MSDRTGLRVGIDIDDVIYPWYDVAHKVMEKAGVTNGVTPSTWYPYEEYGISREEWREILGDATKDGSLFLRGTPNAGSVENVARLREAGHHVHLITSRGYLPYGAVAKAQTAVWLHGYGIEYDALTFTNFKGDVALDYHVDDVEKNLIEVAINGAQGFLYQQKWNTSVFDWPVVESLGEYVDYILENS